MKRISIPRASQVIDDLFKDIKQDIADKIYDRISDIISESRQKVLNCISQVETDALERIDALSSKVCYEVASKTFDTIEYVFRQSVTEDKIEFSIIIKEPEDK